MGVVLMETVDFLVDCIILEPLKQSELFSEDERTESQESLSHVCGVITNILVQSNIPHNILIANGGKSFYIIPRNWEVDSNEFGNSVLDLSGAISCFNHQTFMTTEFQNYFHWANQNIKLDHQKFANIKNEIIQILETEYTGKTQ